MDDIKELLEAEINAEMVKLSDLELGSNEYKIAVEGISKLLDKQLEIEKFNVDVSTKNKDYELENKKYDLENRKAEGELADKAKSREIESEKLSQISNDKKDQLFKNGIAVANIVIPSLITIWGTFKTLKFEETGTVTPIMGRGFVNKLIPKK